LNPEPHNLGLINTSGRNRSMWSNQ